jgi:hypothetical protein
MCPERRQQHTRLTSRSFYKRYSEHLQPFKYRNSNWTFARHLHGIWHSFVPMENIMDILHFVKIEKTCNFLKHFYIYSETKINNQINEESTTGSNKIYNVVIQHANDSCQLKLQAYLLTYSNQCCVPQSHPN